MTLPWVRYASTRRLPPHLGQEKTSKSNVLLSNSAQSTRGVLCVIGSFLAAASIATLVSSAPAWGSSVWARTRPQGGGQLLQDVGAEGYAVLPPGRADFQPGDTVDFERFDRPRYTPVEAA